VTLDPYPDLAGAEPLDLPPVGRSDGAGDERPALSDADRRLLAALSRHEPPVVTAIEDQPRTGRTPREDGVAALPVFGRGPLTPVFREPTD